MRDPKEGQFRAALGTLRGFLKERGFRSKGSAFWRSVEGNVVMVALQRSATSSSGSTSLTLNYGVYSSRIGRQLEDDAAAATDVNRAHWRMRLQREGREMWVAFQATDAPGDVARGLLAVIEPVLHTLCGHASDLSLRDGWLEGTSPGIGLMQRLLFLAILLNEIGPSDELPHVVAELRALVEGSVHADLVERRLAKLGLGVPPSTVSQ